MADGISRGGFVFHARNALTAIERLGSEIAKWDLEGRPVSAQFEDVYFRRGISNEMMARGKLARAGRILDASERRAVLERFRGLAEDAGAALGRGRKGEGPLLDLEKRLGTIRAKGPEKLEREAALFRSIYRPVPILPPDRTLAFVVQLTEGCPWNRCSFCGLYPDRDFAVKEPAALEDHLVAALRLFGRGALLRRSVYIGDGDPFVLPDGKLIPLLDQVLELFHKEEEAGNPLPSKRDLYAFARLHSLRGRSRASLAEYRARAFRRLYIGVETGDPELYRILRKPGRLEDLPEVLGALREAGIAAGLIFLVGVGGDRFRRAHRERTARLVSSLSLGGDDLVYLSPFCLVAGSPYAAWANEERIAPLDRAEIGAEAAEIVRAMRALGSRAKTAYYPLEHFVY